MVQWGRLAMLCSPAFSWGSLASWVWLLGAGEEHPDAEGACEAAMVDLRMRSHERLLAPG